MKINPALLTHNEYLRLVNSSGRIHSGSPYQMSVEKINSFCSSKDFSRLINNITVCGIRFELREKQIDLHQKKYMKIDKNKNIERDQDGNIVYLTKEEVEKKIPERFSYEHAIIEASTNKIVGYTADEYGCLLIAMATEYQGLGLGSILLKKQLERHPDRETGGLSNNGQSAYYSVYKDLVAKALSQGVYRKAYLAGEMSYKQICDILTDGRVSKKLLDIEKSKYSQATGSDSFFNIINRKKSPNINLNTSNTKDWLLHCDDNFAILYSKNIFELLKHGDKYEYFIEKAIKGYIYIGGVYHADDVPKLFRMHAENDKIKSYLIELMLNKSINEPIRASESHIQLIKDKLGKKLKIEKIFGSDLSAISIDSQTINDIPVMSFIEKTIRKQNDNFDEAWNQIQEIAYSLGEDAYNNEVKKKEELNNSYSL